MIKINFVLVKSDSYLPEYYYMYLLSLLLTDYGNISG